MYVESFITTQRGARASEQRDGRERATRKRGVCAGGAEKDPHCTGAN